ncbi:MAG TPA: non-canonical purine NTP pyrophosphatase [Anaeromyxobacter sp.]|nr:non-canonical purine NTP pyrophosphatase [Anaeromyxobacter sp.]
MDLLFGTTNAGKLRELRRLVAGLPIRVLSPDDLGRPLPDVEEDGATFAANAEKKAAEWARFAGVHALADDSGLCVDALDGAPGVRSARWSDEEPEGLSSPACELPGVAAPELGPVAGRAARDERNNDKLLRALAAVPDARRGAEYRAVLALAGPDGRVLSSVTGACRGRIGRERRGDGGFGYDPLFVPETYPARTMAELPPEEKDAISHRGEAFRRLRPVLEALVRALDETGPKR